LDFKLKKNIISYDYFKTIYLIKYNINIKYKVLVPNENNFAQLEQFLKRRYKNILNINN